MPDHRFATVTAVVAATGICTVTDDSGASYDAKAIGWLPLVGDKVWVEKRGEHQSDWVITGIHAAPATSYFEQWDYNGFSVPNNSQATLTPQNSMFLTGDYGSAWSGNTWTAPVAGPYLWTVVAHPISSATNRAYVRVQTGGAVVLFGLDESAPAALWLTVTACEWFPVGQTIQVVAFQQSGVAQVQDGVARVAVTLMPT